MPDDSAYLDLLWAHVQEIQQPTQGTTSRTHTPLGAWVGERRSAKNPSEVENSLPAECSGAKSLSDVEASFSQGRGAKSPSKVPELFSESRGAKSISEVKASLPKRSGAKYPSPSEVKASDYQLWALIIGINEYANKRPLSGAVADANAMKEYLETSLKVPKDHIVNLRDQAATRRNIISAFEGLRDNDRIKKHDPILIYYAGHGGELWPKDDGNKIQALIPVDYVAEKICPIPDRTVASLVNGIANKRGNNITFDFSFMSTQTQTVILDCCHSGSGTRGDETDNSTVRGCELSPNDVPDHLDADIRRANLVPEPEPGPTSNSAARGLVSARGFAVRGMKSHILLAACSANEEAREDFKPASGLPPIARGRFTTALLELFQTVPPNQITYAEVLTKILPIDGFEGKKYILEAGKAHGITDGAEFTLYRDMKVALLEAPLGVMKAKDGNIEVFTTTLEPVDKPPGALDNPAIAIQTRAGASEDLLIHVPLEAENAPIFQAIARELSGEGPNPCRIKLVDRDKAKLEIVTTEGKLTFTTLDERATEYGFTRLPHVVDANVENLRHILRGAAHYHFHLNHQHPNNKIQTRISIEFFPLKEELDEDDDTILSPGGENMIQGGRIQLKVDEGMSITALTEVGPRTRHRKDYSLEKDAEVKIGYGESHIPPFESDIAKDLDLTFGFLKFYFASEVVDLSHIPQKSPFYSTRGFMTATRRPIQNVCGTVLIPVIQRRKRKP
ncbi:hypothetical protein EST38_g5036 [Candolleomyces aberdarensis]|uniref:Peptidase C14 caspase domain-containing protein n=1 Tax=Candolleomyces aberdarensis TaxID=2316362 RepID=A0A4V1Q445_9AGAR|nr:hypothetical protein EST38_g5036 [Candolleomyces aberdarensis]